MSLADFRIPQAEVRYERTHGLHEFEMVDGTPLRSISVPTWEQYLEKLSELPEKNGYIVSPELITSPYPLAEVPARQTQIKARTEQVRWLSEWQPTVTVLLGTATFTGAKPRNSMVAFQEGQRTGEQYKGVAFYEEEAKVFESDTEFSARVLDNPTHSLLICSDLIQVAGQAYGRMRHDPESENPELEKRISSQATSLILAACWGLPFPQHARDTT